MTSSITALTTLPANVSRVSVVRAAITEEVSVRPNASNRQSFSEHVVEGELLRSISSTDFTIDDIVGVQADIGFDPRFTFSVGSRAIASNDAVAAYLSNGSVFRAEQRQVDTFV